MTITIREPGSAITHLIGLLLAAFAAIPMLVKAALFSTRTAVAAMAVFMTSMILLYAASTLYHSVNLTGSKLKLFKKLDEDSIFHIFDIVKYKNWYSPKKTFYSPLILRNNP